jgi:monoamine oxidase
MGLQFARRFWEEDDHIYGGHTSPTSFGNITYPSYDWQGQKGTVLAYYNFGGHRGRGQRHVARGAHPLRRSTSARRSTATSTSGSSRPASRSPGTSCRTASAAGPAGRRDARRDHYPRLNEPDGRIFLAGEHLSYMTGWMSGAIESAWIQIEKLHRTSP